MLYAIEEEEKFFEIAIQALEKIKEIDPRRYKRVKQYIHSIAYTRMGVDGYDYDLYCFWMHTFPIDVDDFASEIIHEATHGYLFFKGIEYKQDKKEQHERICCREQFGFYKKLIVNNKNLSYKEIEDRISYHKKYFEDKLKNRWWDENILKEKINNRFISLLSKEYMQKTHYSNGQLKTECKTINGQRSGLYKKYFPSGNLETELYFSKDKANGIAKFYFENGVLRGEGLFKEGKFDNIWRKYDEKGRLKWEANYKYGIEEGVMRWYYENGQVEKEANYSNGILHGLFREFNEDGSLRAEKNYDLPPT